MRGLGPLNRTCTPTTGYFHVKTKISKENLQVDYLLLNSDGVLEYTTRTRAQHEYHFLSTRTRLVLVLEGQCTRYSVKKKSQVHEYISPSLKVINKMNF